MSDTVFDVSPTDAQWYFCAIVDVHGETTYFDGYASGEEPTLAAFQDSRRCLHAWVAGMMYVNDEDVADVAEVRPVECESCERTYADRDLDPLTVIEWEVKPTPGNPEYPNA